MFQWINRVFRKGTDFQALIDLQARKQKSIVGNSFASITREGYKKNGITYRAIQIIATSAATIPWTVQRILQTGDREEIPEGHILNRLIKQPNPKTGHGRFFYELLVYMYLSGYGFIHKLMAGGNVRFLELLRPDLVELVDPDDDEKGFWYQEPNKQRTRIPYEEMIFLRFFDPSSEYCGLSPVQVAGLTIEQGNASRIWNKNLLHREARPSSLIKSKFNFMNKEQKEEFVNDIMSRFGGEDNAGSVAFAAGDFEWISMGLPPAQMEWLEGQKLADRGTANTLGVPSQLLGDKDAATYSNYQEARKSLYEETVIPLLQTIVDEFNSQIVIPTDPNLEYSLDTESIDALQPNKKEEWERIQNSDVLTINEKREQMKFEKVQGPGGDLIIHKSGLIITGDGEILVPRSLIPIEDVGQDMGGIGPDGFPIPGNNGNPNKPTSVPDPSKPENSDNPTDATQPTNPKSSDPGPFNLNNKAEKELYWKGFENRRRQFTISARILCQRQFQKERKLIKESLRNGNQNPEDLIQEDMKKGWQEVYQRIYETTGSYFARGVLNSLPKSMDMILETKAIRASDLIDIWATRVEIFIREQAAKKIVGITDYTRSQVKDVLSEGISLGEGIDKLAARIDTLFLDEIIPNRSEVIARTEVIAASNAGSDFAAGITGLELEKEWIAVSDDRTRESHADMDGEKVAMSDVFIVGDSGSKLSYPGDITHNPDAEEVINCRCVIGYHPIGE